MATVTANTWVVDPDGAPAFLEEGADVPAWAADQVGDHLLEGGEDAEATSYDDQTIPDLKKEIDRRNADRDPEGDSYIKPDGTKKADLVAALKADDKAQAGSDDGSDAGDGGGDGGSQQ